MVIWTDTAINHITQFIKEAQIDTEKNAKLYMNKLIDYTQTLEEMPEIGKAMEHILGDYEIRQLIYKKHRIIYHINKENVVILSVLHTRLDINKALKKLKKEKL